MATQDETTFFDSQNELQKPVEQTTDAKQRPALWKTVSIGGITGIALGVAGTRGIDAVAATSAPEEQPEEQFPDEQEHADAGIAMTASQATVDQNLSFSEAFAAARAEVGPGGVFLWHGQLYGTYYADEWQSMSDAERDAYGASVQPLLGQQTSEPRRPAPNHIDEEESKPEVQVEPVAHDDENHQDNTQHEVHFLGVDQRDDDGQSVNVGYMTVDDVNVALVDLDNDEVFDVSLIDKNRNNEIEDDEIHDVSGEGITVSDFKMLSELDAAGALGGQADVVSNTHEDLAPDMPDYMNDADTGII